jgi:Holliday junction resolvase RusA-like endonuclease
MIQLQIDCDPVSWSAAIKGRSGFYDKKAKEKEFARWQIKAQYRETPISGHVSLDFIFFLPIPKATSKAMRKQMLERRVLPTSPDLTNLQKLYEDCLQGIVIDNDRYSNKISSVRYYSERPGVKVTIRTWEEEINRSHETTQQKWSQL